ncbi:MAG: hypothetical protein JWM59_3833 [Verrucomicrobiales bacterium]|nr:hypothetical protein [Verrucomicrobiales bacterium]
MFHIDSDAGRSLPGPWAGIVFLLKAAVLRWKRRWRDRGRRRLRYAPRTDAADTGRNGPVIRTEKRSALWGQPTAVEFPLTAGKVENLRRAARDFQGLEIPAGGVLSFWRQLGRPVRRRGFVPGRGLREGCVIPVGGGLCQLSGLLYQAALEAGLEMVERHAHSRTLPGSSAEQGLDATVFWNYVDLRLRSPASWRLEVELTASELIVRILRSATVGAESRVVTNGKPSAGISPAATVRHAPSLGHSAFLLDARWPEFDDWCAGHSREGDRWLTSMDGRRWRKRNYAWTPAPGVRVVHAILTALLRSFRQRRLPAQGAVRQQALLAGDEVLAHAYARQLKPECRHLVVSQNLLPHLWRAGVLAGRTVDVLMHRWLAGAGATAAAGSGPANPPPILDPGRLPGRQQADSGGGCRIGRSSPACDPAPRYGADCRCQELAYRLALPAASGPQALRPAIHPVPGIASFPQGSP